MKSVKNLCENFESIFPRREKLIKSDNIDLFEHPIVKIWYNYFLNFWKSSKPFALLLPCTSVKPYSLSATHKLAYSILRKHNIENVIQVYSVSEPMLLVPKELEECYPFNSYEYPPKLMTEKEREKFILLLTIPLKKLEEMHTRIVAVLPKHHYNIVNKASQIAKVKVILIPYGRLAFQSISKAILSFLKD
jgi:predicted RNA-binding protein